MSGVFREHVIGVTVADMLTDELMARRPTGRHGLVDWYAEVFEAQRAEGLSAADLATLLSVTPTNIYYWKRRLRELGAGSSPGREKAGAGLVRVEVPSMAEPPAGGSGGYFEVRLSGSRSILVPRGFAAGDLRQLVTTLESC